MKTLTSKFDNFVNFPVNYILIMYITLSDFRHFDRHQYFNFRAFHHSTYQTVDTDDTVSFTEVVSGVDYKPSNFPHYAPFDGTAWDWRSDEATPTEEMKKAKNFPNASLYTSLQQTTGTTSRATLSSARPEVTSDLLRSM
jgi:hypothetical protein